MVNRQKERGDRYERDILAKVKAYGFHDACRTRPGRKEDQGDIQLNPWVILQTKDVATPLWRPWLKQLAEQIQAAKAEHGAIVLKRRGHGATPPVDVVLVPLDEYLSLVKDAGY